ncbi:hypothetical protein RUM44_003483 [Polyplax serrata]|uniref:DUF4708 domain-containing protein n=1 Tax=Polyplax serrata TaxID=468196 RepID=A0ABR1AGK8_POLSC
MENKTLFSTIPKLNQLKHFLVIIDFAEIEEVTFLNVFNKQKILARRLIESRDDILAAPVKGQISHIHLIISEDSYERNELEATLDSLKLILNGPFFLPYIVYLRAIHFTLNVKLSDEWNEVQNYFVKSDKFLKTKEILQSVRVHLFITDASLGVCAYGLRLKLPEISLSDLGVDIDKFYSTGFAETKKTVYTLPDFKSATALGVYMNLPNTGPFKEYSDLRNYWKIVYGYPLPENEEGMVYVDVTFGWNSITYVYPIICLFPYEPLPFKSKMPFESIYGFLETVERKFPKICGHPLNIRTKARSFLSLSF